jgi:hypothetical protein
MAETHIQFDHVGESQSFTATRDVNGSEHRGGIISAGSAVFFTLDLIDMNTVTLQYVDGRPTDGQKFRRFRAVEFAEAFADHVGLSDDTRPLTGTPKKLKTGA